MANEPRLACFKSYDVRGRVPQDLDEDLAYRIGRAYAAEIQPRGPVAVGRDIRLTGPALSQALTRGLLDAGVDVVDVGICGTEMIYFAAARPGMGGGIMITASHNPKEYNGMKFVREQAIPISGDSGLQAIERRARTGDFHKPTARKGVRTEENLLDAYVQALLDFVDIDALKPFRIVVNPGNGCAGPVIDALAPHLPFDFVRVNFEPDGEFPNGVPNPLLEQNRPITARAVRENQAHLGIAWDGDFDRCFFFDDRGEFVDGYYLVGLLAKIVLNQYPGGKIIHDPRLTWNTIEIVTAAGGVPVLSKTGHAFVKERMRKEDAVYGGEISAHHYFRDFAYCDTGMAPWLLITQLMSLEDRDLGELVAERRRKYPISGEINRRVQDAEAVIARARARYAPQATAANEVDGISFEFDRRWRFNLRRSQTEPLLRLNVETAGDPELLANKTAELLELIGGEPA